MVDIIAGIDSQNQVRVETTIKGLYKNNTYSAIIDTGFSGSLVLPLVIALQLGLEKAGAGNVTLADGTSQVVPIFMCKVRIGSIEQDADTLVMGNDVLVGMDLMNQFKLCLTPKSGAVTIEPASKTPTTTTKFTSLVDIMRRLTGRSEDEFT